jgi:hypothetical protein
MGSTEAATIGTEVRSFELDVAQDEIDELIFTNEPRAAFKLLR